MKIEILKTGSYSLHPAWGPIVNLTEGQELTLKQFEKACKKCDTNPLQAMKDLVADKWAIELESDEDIETEDEDEDEGSEGNEGNNEPFTDVSVHLNKLIEGKTEDESKQLIQDWGMINCNHKVTKAKTIENMIAELVEEYKKFNEE